MEFDLSRLPTPVALVARRLNVTGPNASANTFLEASYLAEAAVKTIAVALYAGLRERASADAYRVGYELVRGDGFGVWEQAIRDSTRNPLSSFLPPDFRELLAWATKKRTKPEDDWFRSARDAAAHVLRELGVEDDFARHQTSLSLISILVQIRNKTKAHGAVGEDFYLSANGSYLEAVRAFVANCPVFTWKWFHLLRREKGTVRGVWLTGASPSYQRDEEASRFPLQTPGVHFVADPDGRAYACADLLRANAACTSFLIPNGDFRAAKGEAEFIDYASGATSHQDVASFLRPPAPLPPSETEGMETLDVQSNVFGNLPSVPREYVQRKELQRQLQDRLLDSNHPIITLHGQGGVGKTNLALHAAHELADNSPPQFESIVWFSARDIDLRPSGPSRVRPAVLDLKAVCKAYAALFQTDGTPEGLAAVLRAPNPGAIKGTLFIFDNFETMADATELHQFLDTYTHLPNKVLITSRERAFKADYPIEVRGMEYPEAVELIQTVARSLQIGGHVSEEVTRRIYDLTGGHAYVMRVIVGEMAKEQKYVPPLTVMGRRTDIVDAVFQRSFDKLSPSARWVFLTVSNWKSIISEVALLVVLGMRDIDVLAGIEECRRLSLVVEDVLADGQPCFSAPHLARVFGRKKLDGDPDRLVIHEDLETLQRFGTIDASRREQQTHVDQIRPFLDWCLSGVEDRNKEMNERVEHLLELVGDLWPPGWLVLAEFRKRIGAERALIEKALRRAVEEMPSNKDAWLERARFAAEVGDEATKIAALVSAVEAAPTDVFLIREAAHDVTRYLNEHITEIPRARRGVYLASLRTRMAVIADKLDATGLSRLAWLFLLEENAEEAWRYAERGTQLDPSNDHCRKILQRLAEPGAWHGCG